VGVINVWILSCLFPLPFVPSRQGRGKWTFYELVKRYEYAENGEALQDRIS